MTTYSDERAAISRTPQILVEITLDYCSRTFGVSPCLATGAPCYNTWPTCKYTSAYVNAGKTYKFSRNDRPLIGPGIRPYIADYKELPTEIDPSRNVTINARVTLEMLDDENDSDIGIDPYVSQRSSVQGSFWKKLIARNTYYTGRTVIIKKGYHGMQESDYTTVGFKGIINSIDGPTKGRLRLIIKDYLKKADKVDVPEATKGKVTDNPLSSGAATINLDDASEYSASGWVRTEDEIIQYSGKSGNQLTGCTRGAFSTTAAQHSQDTTVQQCSVYQSQNPWDIIYDILINKIGFLTSDIDTTGATNEKNTWLQGYVYTGIISKPMKATNVLKELCEQSHANIWWDNESQLIRFKVTAPTVPGQTVKAINDEANIIHESTDVDRNEASKITRVVFYYNKKAVGDDDKDESYIGKVVVWGADKEGVNEHNEKSIKKIYSRWVTTESIAATVGRRILARFKLPPSKYIFSLELKDDDLKTGDVCSVASDDYLDVAGNQEQKKFQILKKEPKGVNTIQYMGLDTYWNRRYAFIAPAGYPDYPSASAAQREYAFIGDANNKVNGGIEDGYYIW